ncbi:hypothetical protein SDRG_08166 [Saprolegnia diclina VS20]|uniref:EGF-like domain-containing protein n=1 Tax=Saprolegnia diclina (strain VS20) TaxID=1156394 RepID=T0QI35_SAPDV|nr:hypothetical protein SDRG_08166 [Saprolegnia diclina VS20]EQC34396.1 hypothetical protein SDRG_08166 [Saprolegnia diclina VS20]|eukprot:XP_008612258.1 hypothetical protein SDRG_08166 [Saprolegnia diclina VS20]
MWLVALLPVLLRAVAAQSHQWVEHFYGFVRGDSYQYFTFHVPLGVVQVDATVSLSLLGGRTPPVLLLKKNGIPSEADYDVRWNTSANNTYISSSIPDLQTGIYYATMWGGNIMESINTFGVGPSVNMWYFLDFTFLACDDADVTGADCSVNVVPTSKQPQGTSPSLKQGSVPVDCLDVGDPTRVFTFELPSAAAGLSAFLVIDKTRGSVAWALYHGRANPLAASAVAVAANSSTNATQLRVDRPLRGTWHIVVSVTDANGFCYNGDGVPFSLAWMTTPCATNDALCVADYELMGANRDSANGVGDFVLAASFANPAPSVANASAPIGFVVDVPAMYAGAAMTLQLASKNLTNDGTIYIRANGLPSPTLFDYRFSIAAATPMDDPTLRPYNPQAPPPLAFPLLKAMDDEDAVFWQLPPIVFPKVDAIWYILLVPPPSPPNSSYAVALNMASLACPPEYACSNRGTCLVKTSYQGLSYGRCACHYGYGGRQCEVSIYSTSERLGRSWLLLGSNAAIVPAGVFSWRRKLYVEAVLFFGLGIISALYHACDLEIFCLLPYPFLQAMDFAFTFNAILLGFIHLSGAFKHVKAAMQVFVLVSLVFMTSYDATSMRNWLVIGVVCACQFIGSWTYYLTLAAQRLGCSLPSALKRFLLNSDNFEYRYLVLGFLLFGGAFGCFFAEVGTSYWLIHSLWHLTAMSSACTFMALRKNIRYRCVGADGVDVLSHDYTVLLRLKASQVNPSEVTLDINPSSTRPATQPDPM